MINGDDGQIQQSLLNLLINARDAMPHGGKIMIQTVIKKSGTIPNHLPLPAGDYIMISIIDTGDGMDENLQQHIFEPFFTTKDQGKGTGLGLSVAYGVVTAHSGLITVKSNPGEGSQFDLYFPLYARVADQTVRPTPASTLPCGHENLLIVDDEQAVATVIAGMLEELGYATTIVTSGKKALALYKQGSRFDVVILDLNMPKMSGKETFEKLKEIDPAVCVLISTGYSNRVVDAEAIKDKIAGILQKPYQVEELARTLRNVLDRTQVESSSSVAS
jgi:CheY-like chemotaxis protein